MKLVRSVVAAAALLGSFSAHAALVFSEAAAGGYLGALQFTTTNAFVTSPTTGSTPGVKLAPLTVGNSNPYSLITTGGVATIDFAGDGVSIFQFLWGSPDTYNYIDVVTADGTTTFGGADLGVLANPDFAANGNNANTRLFTILGTNGTLIDSLTFRSNGVAFEVAAAVPLPAAAWLLLSGLAGLGVLGRRRKTA